MPIAPHPPPETLIDDKRREIKTAMAALGREIRRGNDCELLHWIIPAQLACAHRPLRYHPQYGASRTPLPHSAAPLVEE
jgi:hypothetical protein